jgi:hypothetical protein
VHVRSARLPLYAAGLAAIAAAALTGCGANSSSGSGSAAAGTPAAPGGTPAAPGGALGAVRLAAKTASGANSFTGTMAIQIAAKPGASGSGDFALAATFAERLHPALLASVDIGSLSSSGTSLPGGLSEIVTPGTLYLKWNFLTQELHLTRPWLTIPVSAMSKSSGVNLGQIFGEATGSGPLTESQLLAGATAVRQVGTGTLDGVPVTEYTGTLPLDKGIAYLSGSARTQLQQAITAAGFTTAAFTVWIDGQHLVRKAIVTEVGKTVSETTTTTITSINQPLSVTVPSASQTSPLPGGDLGNLS